MSDLISNAQRERYPQPPLAPKHYRVRMRVLNCDNVIDSQGDAFEPGCAYFDNTSRVPIQHEFRETLLGTWGYATLESVLDKDGKQVGVDAILDFQMPDGQDEGSLAYLYAAIGGSGIENRKDYPELGQNSWTKVSIQRIGICLSRNCDHRIGPLSTGTRLPEEEVHDGPGVPSVPSP